jgi:hypothetical protein
MAIKYRLASKSCTPGALVAIIDFIAKAARNGDAHIADVAAEAWVHNEE